MRGRPAHQSDEVVVLFGGQSVSHDGADALRVGLAGRVEPEAHLHKLVLEIPVYGLGAADDPDLGTLLQEKLSQKRGVGVGVVTPYHNQTVQLEALAVLEGQLLVL